MANHVNTNVDFYRITDEGKAKLQEMISRVRKDQNYEWFSDLWVDGEKGSPTYEESMQYSWTCENVGPKWCYFDEVEDTRFRLTSAWNYPEAGLAWLSRQIGKVDPTVIMTATFEDEMPNFYGVGVFTADGVYDAVLIEYDELVDDLNAQYPELLELYDEEQDPTDQSEEYDEMFRDLMWEHMTDNQDDTIANIIDSIIEE
jgi:hypothetical protein